MVPNTMSDLLHRIIADARHIKRTTSLQPQLPIPLCTITPPKLDLEFPHDIITSIDDLNLSSESRRRLKQVIRQKVQDSQVKVFQVHERMCRTIPDMPDASTMLDRVAKIHQQMYENCYLSRFREEISKLHTKIEHSGNSGSRTKAVFKPEYTPLLEKYFEKNAYPSSQDRLVLTRKTKMTARQIEVWFQNHRNRAKKEGKPLRRWSSHHSIDTSAASLSETSPLSDQPIEQRLNTPDEDILKLNPEIEHPETLISKDSNVFQVLNECRPSYAFPTPYPPNEIINPFPNKEGAFKFPAPIWRRRPASTTSHTSAIDVEELVAMFSVKLNLRQSSSKVSKTSRTKEASLVPWFSSTVTVSFPAPHPAFLRSSYTPVPSQISNMVQFSRGNWQLTSPLHPPPSFPSWKVSSHENVKPRKLAAIPRRIPSKIRSCMVDSSSLQTSSRSTSLASVSSSGSQSSSFSHESSPEPVTPPLSPNFNVHDIQNFTLCDEDLDSFASFFSPNPDFQYSPRLDFLNNETLEKESFSSLYGIPSIFPPMFDLLSQS